MSKQSIAKFLGQKQFEANSEIGVAAGVRNRARTMQSKKDKATDPRRLRREFRAMKDEGIAY